MYKEIWKDINGYEGLYQISNLGRVKSLVKWDIGKKEFIKCDLIKKTRINHKGYEQLHLSKNGIDKNFTIHRLVAKAFIPNPDNFSQVNHKDENKTNNCVDNLEWCDNDYNIHYGTRNQRIGKTLSKKMIAIKNNNVIGIFENTKYASEELNIPRSSIICVLNGYRKQAKGYNFKYVD